MTVTRCNFALAALHDEKCHGSSSPGVRRVAKVMQHPVLPLKPVFYNFAAAGRPLLRGQATGVFLSGERPLIAGNAGNATQKVSWPGSSWRSRSLFEIVWAVGWNTPMALLLACGRPDYGGRQGHQRCGAAGRGHEKPCRWAPPPSGRHRHRGRLCGRRRAVRRIHKLDAHRQRGIDRPLGLIGANCLRRNRRPTLAGDRSEKSVRSVTASPTFETRTGSASRMAFTAEHHSDIKIAMTAITAGLVDVNTARYVGRCRESSNRLHGLTKAILTPAKRSWR